MRDSHSALRTLQQFYLDVLLTVPPIDELAAPVPGAHGQRQEEVEEQVEQEVQKVLKTLLRQMLALVVRLALPQRLWGLPDDRAALARPLYIDQSCVCIT